ncbi:MAG: 1-(5-phosphoribosyl)-5-[(5-phosphoribosylamino)methylideneamino]imidazole-4-carboxamide isomerase [Bacteroidales bacterium]
MIEIIPAIDIIEGKCVRLTKGDYNQKKIYNENPLEVAKEIEQAGIKRLHVVDLDGAKSNRIINYKTLETIASNTTLIIDFGGGLKSDDDLRIAFECGAQMITGGSIAVKNPELFTSWIEKYGCDKIILGADVHYDKIAVQGWTETSDKTIFEFLESYKQKGIKKVICTDISKDGMLQGTSNTLYAKIKEQFPDLYLIASGGVSSISDIETLQELHIEAVIIGKALYEGKISLKELVRFL